MSEEQVPSLEERIRALPETPGVYLFRDARGAVLYVGKAQSLRHRVRSYFQRGGDGRFRMDLLVPRVQDVEVIVTANVKEALLLENQLIKRHKPRFNVRLRDDKSYLGLRVDPGERYPRIRETRRFARDGALYFGPYTSSVKLRETLGALQRVFPLRTCSEGVFHSYQLRGRPCIEHSLGRCVAPCVGKVSDEEYAELVQGSVAFLRGKGAELSRALRARMRRAAAEEHFEEAARMRDRVEAIERTVEAQAMVSTRFADRDVFGLAREAADLEIQILHVRQGRLLGGSHHAFRDVRIGDAEALGSFLAQFYEGEREWPREVLVPLEPEGREALEELWAERAGRHVRLRVARRGEGRRLVEMAARNAALALAERARREGGAAALLEDVAALLRLPAPPHTIECYDTSHLRGDLHVASRVRFEDGEPAKAGYRRYRLQEVAPGDDYGAMREVLRRRLQKLQSDPAPDLILLDGGKGQLNAVRAVARDLGLEGIALAALAKERDTEARTPRAVRHGGSKHEKLYLPGVKDPIEPDPARPGLRLLQRVRDESHRFAIRYHQTLRRKSALRSILDEIPGIGPVKRRALLRELGSLDAVKRASPEELQRVARITRSDAVRIHRFFADEGGTVFSS